MTRLILIRHGTTEWNSTHLVQGRADIPLNETGRAEVASWRLPNELMTYRWIASPLSRARETARILFGQDVETNENLVEMDWGDWEGQKLADLRAKLGDLMAAWEAKGLDFKAPNGESPREVQIRTRPCLKELAQDGRPTVAVIHKGVIRALYAAATGWDMTSKEPERIQDGCWHSFILDGDGGLKSENLNMPMTDAP